MYDMQCIFVGSDQFWIIMGFGCKSLMMIPVCNAIKLLIVSAFSIFIFIHFLRIEILIDKECLLDIFVLHAIYI